nr:restriction endonuclease subunit S [Dermacoccus sp. CCH2-D9]
MKPGDVIYSKIRPYLQKAYRCDFKALCSADMYPLTPRRGTDSSFIMHTILGRDFTNFAVSVSARSGIPKINREELAEYRMKVPGEAEQRAIGQTLDDADALIATLERLIAKKQAIKQGMMQQLLTGRTRLPGFAGKWTPVRLRDVGSTYGGLIGKGKNDFGTGSAVFVTFMEVMAGVRLVGNRLARVNVGTAERQNRVLRGDVLFNGSSETPEEVALAAVVDFDTSPQTYLNSFCFGYRLKDREHIDPTYLAYFFRSSQGRDIVSVLAQGATRYNIAKTKLMQVAPVLPPIDEQRAIVNVLRDSEIEVDALDLRLQKARAIKTGMMQQLLTGRVRLPVETVS